MDINLPGLSGVECVRRLKALLPEVQVVMLTVYEDTDLIFACAGRRRHRLSAEAYAAGRAAAAASATSIAAARR